MTRAPQALDRPGRPTEDAAHPRCTISCGVTPDAANKLAVAFWGQFDKRWMDGLDNIDGSSTEPGQCYQGFACVDCGAGSVFLSVEQVDTDPWFLGTNALKKALKSRRLDCGTDGAKGDAARRLLASRLQGYISVAKQKPEEKGAGASVGLTSSPSSSSSSSSSAVGGAATSSIDVASPEQPEPKKVKLDCFSKLAADLGCPPDCYLVAVLHDELTFHVVSKAEKKVLRSLFMPWVFFKEDGTTVGTAKPDVENIYNDAYLQDARLSGDTYLILKQFVLAHHQLRWFRGLGGLGGIYCRRIGRGASTPRLDGGGEFEFGFSSLR